MAGDLSDPEFIAMITAYLSIVMLVAVQGGLGCTVTVNDLRETLQRPRAVCIGLGAQVILMPLIAYLLALMLDMKGDDLLGLALVACTPGGSMSNVFSYYSRGNMALSIALTVLSNLLAFGTMPAAIAVLAPDSVVPFAKIVETLAYTIVPTAIGIALKTYRPRIALWGEKIGSVVGGITVIGAIASGIAGNVDKIDQLPLELFISTSLLGVLGMLSAYCLGVLGKIRGSKRITLCIETGVQNLALTLALVALSFNNKFSIVVYSYIFGLVICIECLVFVGFTRMPYIRRHACGVDPEDVEEPQPVPNVSVGENLDGDPEGFRPDSASLSESKAVAVKAEPEPQRKRSFFSWA
eukprot:CAMPEP_0185178758 /NCGR_PEP_ID=MMETSP1139-20130426/31669_1 /TAXON_ID=298111 /ORGANISM="Pavlova sp., Strain CCMP459" /LENGTH=352 /DNA_ID=CAMNT_0027744589 /DNA_START=96 /DNA_END=1154 /DNA_ORIENTATION=+